MCATKDAAETAILRNQDKPFTAWKSVGPNAGAVWAGGVRYKPGVNQAKCSYGDVTRDHDYNAENAGVHAYFSGEDALQGRGECVVPVKINPWDVIAVESPKHSYRQVVACRVTVDQRAWEKAGVRFRDVKPKYRKPKPKKSTRKTTRR